MSKQADYLNQYLKTLSSFQAQEIEVLDALLQSWQPQLAAKIWHSMGYPIIGYGESCYQNKRGQNNKWFIIGLAAHKSYFSFYIWGIVGQKYLLEAYQGSLGQRTKVGKSCLNFKKSADLNLRALEAVIAQAVNLNQ